MIKSRLTRLGRTLKERGFQIEGILIFVGGTQFLSEVLNIFIIFRKVTELENFYNTHSAEVVTQRTDAVTKVSQLFFLVGKN